jgi:hypothetical protein
MPLIAVELLLLAPKWALGLTGVAADLLAALGRSLGVGVGAAQQQQGCDHHLLLLGVGVQGLAAAGRGTPASLP